MSKNLDTRVIAVLEERDKPIDVLGNLEQGFTAKGFDLCKRFEDNDSAATLLFRDDLPVLLVRRSSIRAMLRLCLGDNFYYMNFCRPDDEDGREQLAMEAVPSKPLNPHRIAKMTRGQYPGGWNDIDYLWATPNDEPFEEPDSRRSVDTRKVETRKYLYDPDYECFWMKPVRIDSLRPDPLMDFLGEFFSHYSFLKAEKSTAEVRNDEAWFYQLKCLDALFIPDTLSTPFVHESLPSGFSLSDELKDRFGTFHTVRYPVRAKKDPKSRNIFWKLVQQTVRNFAHS